MVINKFPNHHLYLTSFITGLSEAKQMAA
uniref:Uncharacterized protein n=1 Tax=Rhizophora mucronata TaxID=61149 RepID=A0A2P2P382_RHIMU